MTNPGEQVEKIGGNSEKKAEKVGGFLLYLAIGVVVVLVAVTVALVWHI